MVLGLDIGGTHIRAGIVEGNYRLRNFVMRSSVDLFNSTNPIVALHDFILEYAGSYLGGRMPDAVSIGFPSTINKDRTTVLSTPNLRHFNNLEVVGPLVERLGIPVFINRDVNLLLIHDIYEYRLEDGHIVIGCYIGTGLGNAISIGGEMLAGRNGVAGELGHIPVYGSDSLCGCGNKGCMETMTSGWHLEELNDMHYAGEAIADIFTNHSGDDVVRGYVEDLAIPIVTEINILDPDYVVLGGGVLQMKDFPIEVLLQQVHRLARKPFPEKNLRITIASGKQESGVVGAGMYAFSRLWDDGLIRAGRQNTYDYLSKKR